jgi:hypothetical protein
MLFLRNGRRGTTCPCSAGTTPRPTSVRSSVVGHVRCTKNMRAVHQQPDKPDLRTSAGPTAGSRPNASSFSAVSGVLPSKLTTCLYYALLVSAWMRLSETICSRSRRRSRFPTIVSPTCQTIRGAPHGVSTAGLSSSLSCPDRSCSSDNVPRAAPGKGRRIVAGYVVCADRAALDDVVVIMCHSWPQRHQLYHSFVLRILVIVTGGALSIGHHCRLFGLDGEEKLLYPDCGSVATSMSCCSWMHLRGSAETVSSVIARQFSWVSGCQL